MGGRELYFPPVDAVCPGPIDTGMIRSTMSSNRMKARAALGEPFGLAEPAVIVAPDWAVYQTGASLE